jgi:hypothetical protein
MSDNGYYVNYTKTPPPLRTIEKSFPRLLSQHLLLNLPLHWLKPQLRNPIASILSDR